MKVTYQQLIGALGSCGMAFFALGLLAGCGAPDDPARAFIDYRDAVAEVLVEDGSQLMEYSALVLNYPDRDARTVPLPEINVGLRNFWAFKHCDLRAKIAERNTALGRATSAVVQLPYEHDLLIALERCAGALDRTELSAEVLGVLDDVSQRKAATRPAVFWNGTFGSREFLRLFSPSARPLGFDAGQSYVPVAEVEFLLRFHEEFGRVDSEVSGQSLGWAYQGLETSEYAGRLLKSLHEASLYLNQINQLLRIRLKQGKVCQMTTPNRRARELNGAFRRYHIRVTQPYLAALGRSARPWVQAIGELARAQSEVMPPGFRPFYQRYLNERNPDGLWQQHLAAIREHARLWSELFEQCGIGLR